MSMELRCSHKANFAILSSTNSDAYNAKFLGDTHPSNSLGKIQTPTYAFTQKRYVQKSLVMSLWSIDFYIFFFSVHYWFCNYFQYFLQECIVTGNDWRIKATFNWQFRQQRSSCNYSWTLRTSFFCWAWFKGTGNELVSLTGSFIQ